MSSTKKFGTDEKSKIVSDFITGEKITTADLVKHAYENDNPDTIMSFENLEASMPTKKINNPIFFVPMNRFAPITNVLQTAREPYIDATFCSAKLYNKLARSTYAVETSAYAITMQAVDLIITNCFTIFNNGVLLLLNTFYKNNDTFLIDQFKKYIEEYNLETHIILHASEIRDKMIRYTLDDNNIAFGELFITSVLKIETELSIHFAHVMYDFIRSMLLYNAIDLDGLLNFFKSESGQEIEYKEDTESIIESAKYSICVQEMLNVATDDILRCEEIVEINFVTMFYNLTDLIHDAIKTGIYNEDNDNKEDEIMFRNISSTINPYNRLKC